jgi:hypothetical protein
MRLDLTTDDARFAHEQLSHQLRHLQSELAHTEKRELQTALAIDVTRLQKIVTQLDAALEEEGAADEFV